MKGDIKKGRKVRYFAKQIFPKSIVRLIVRAKGGGVLETPKKIVPDNPDSLQCTIATNKYGSFCTPDSCRDDGPVQTLYRGGQYEKETIEYITSLKLRGDVIHAGAYFGDTLPGLVGAIDQNSTIWAFEPNEESFRCAQITLLLNNIQNVVLQQLGLGDKKDEAYLQVTDADDNRLGGTTRIAENPENSTKIQLDRLDDVIPEDRIISLLHLDVEGYEEQVLRGAKRIVSRCKPIIIIEMSTEKMCDTINRLGYIQERGLDPYEWREGYRNAVFKHKSIVNND